MISNKENYDDIQNSILKLVNNPQIVKSRIYMHIRDECLNLFEIGIELSLIEIFVPNGKFELYHNYLNCKEQKCEKCQRVLLYKSTMSKMDKIEFEILLNYNNSNINPFSLSSSRRDDDMEYNTSDNKSLFFDEEMTYDEKEFSKLKNTNDILFNNNNIEFLSHSSTFGSYDENKKSKNNSINLLNEQFFTMKKSTLKQFQFKYAKRENIDKKVLRKFRKFLRCNRESNTDIKRIIYNNKFWFDFTHLKSLLPPFPSTYENKNFKSFSLRYMCWLFAHTASKELYSLFIKSNIDKIEKDFAVKFNLIKGDDELVLITSYVKQLALIFGSSDSSEVLFDIDQKHTIENERKNREACYCLSLRPFIPEIFNDFNTQSQKLHSKTFGYNNNEREETISEENELMDEVDSDDDMV